MPKTKGIPPSQIPCKRNLYVLQSYKSSDNDEVPDLLCRTLIAADLLLADQLREQCEALIARKLSMRNALDLLQFSHVSIITPKSLFVDNCLSAIFSAFQLYCTVTTTLKTTDETR